MYSISLRKTTQSWVLGLNQWPRIMFGLTGVFFFVVFFLTPGQPILALIFAIISLISAAYWEAWKFQKGPHGTPEQVIAEYGLWPFLRKKTYSLDQIFRIEVQIPRGKVFATLATSAKNLGQEFLGTRLDRRVIQIFLVFDRETPPIRILTESTKDYPRIQEMAQELASFLGTDFLVREV